MNPIQAFRNRFKRPSGIAEIDLGETNVDCGTITINGKTYEGRHISICNGDVLVDGVKQSPIRGTQGITIVVHGDAKSIHTDHGNVQANNVVKIKTLYGNVECWDVSKDVITGSGNVICGNVGDMVCTASGNITHKIDKENNK